MSRLRWAPLALLGAILVVAGATQLFSTFMVYDDEGYVLFSLKTFAEGGGLYERVYSQYGPFFPPQPRPAARGVPVYKH